MSITLWIRCQGQSIKGAVSGSAVVFVLSSALVIVPEKAESQVAGTRNANIRDISGVRRPNGTNSNAIVSPTFEHEGLFIDVRRPPVAATRGEKKSVWRYVRSRVESIRQKRRKSVE